MKSISVHVSERDYQELKSLAAASDRPVAELIRQAMADYIQRIRQEGQPLASLDPHDSGALLRPWTRAELLDEALER